MVINPELTEQAYQLFREEALELLELVGEILQAFLDDPNSAKRDRLIQAINFLETIQDGASQLDLIEVQISTYHLQSLLGSLEQESLEINSELTQELEQAKTALSTRLLACFDTNPSAESASPNSKVEPSTADEGNLDVPESILYIELTKSLEHLRKLLVVPETDVEKLRRNIESILALGEMLKLSELAAIAQTTLSALQASPNIVRTIGQLALVGFCSVRDLLSPNNLPTEILEPFLTSTSEWDKNLQEKEPVPEAVQLSKQTSDNLLIRAKSPDQAEIELLEVAKMNPPVASEWTLKTSQLFVWLVGDAIFTLPCDRIEENLLPKVIQMIQFEERRFLQWRKQIVPIYQLSELLSNCPLPELNPTQSGVTSSGEITLTLVIKQNQQIIALESAIEHLIAKSELVVQPLAPDLVLPSYCYGYCAWESDRLIKIIDVAALLDQIFSQNGESEKGSIAKTHQGDRLSANLQQKVEFRDS
jgi:chemotaxis protein histidine kinase CheA